MSNRLTFDIIRRERNADNPNAYDLYVRDKLMIRGESLQLIENVVSSLLHPERRGVSEWDEVARSIELAVSTEL